MLVKERLSRMQNILLVGEQVLQKQSWQVKENVNPVWDCCVKQGGPKAGCDTIETVLRKLEGWPGAVQSFDKTLGLWMISS